MLMEGNSHLMREVALRARHSLTRGAPGHRSLCDIDWNAQSRGRRRLFILRPGRAAHPPTHFVKCVSISGVNRGVEGVISAGPQGPRAPRPVFFFFFTFTRMEISVVGIYICFKKVP